jgi:hypothetical protein
MLYLLPLVGLSVLVKEMWIALVLFLTLQYVRVKGI